MNRPAPKGWCPDAYHPMLAADGYILRIKPRYGRLNPTQIRVLCHIAKQFASPQIQITQRGNLQLRAISPPDVHAAQKALQNAELIDPDPQVESRRNFIFAPQALSADQEQTVHYFYENLSSLPPLPSKFCFGFDFKTNEQVPTLNLQHADIVINATGKEAVHKAIETAHWFSREAPNDITRMRKLPAALLSQGRIENPCDILTPPLGRFHGLIRTKAPFGLISCDILSRLAEAGDILFSIGGIMCLLDIEPEDEQELITQKEDPRRNTRACIGAPYCAAAHGKTIEYASALGGDLHVSGCPKGCADPKRKGTVLLPKGNLFDLVLDGYPWDEPWRKDLTWDQVLEYRKP